MGVQIYDEKLLVTEIKTSDFYFDAPKNVGKNLKHEIDK